MLKRVGIVVTFLAPVVLLVSLACGPKAPDLPLLDAIDEESIDIVREHMEAGTDPNNTFIPPGFPFAGASALHEAVLKDNREIVQILLDHGADIDIRARDEFKGPPLEWAVFFGLRDMAVFLVESGADINARNAYDTTPFDATYANNPFIAADRRKHFDQDRAYIAGYLSKKLAESSIPALPLLTAVDQGYTDTVRDYMQAGADPNETFIPPGFPFAGGSVLHQAALKDNQEIVQLLLDHGADIDIEARDEFNGSPLEWAAFFGLRDMVVFLVESGADVNARNAYGTTPLDATASFNPFIPEAERKQFDENRASIRQYLSEKGAQSGM